MKEDKYPDTYWNHGTTPIFISHSIKADPYGGQGTMEQKVMILPGDGINLSVLNLKRERPNGIPRMTTTKGEE